MTVPTGDACKSSASAVSLSTSDRTSKRVTSVPLPRKTAAKSVVPLTGLTTTSKSSTMGATFLTEPIEKENTYSRPKPDKNTRWMYEHEDPKYYRDLPIAPGISWFKGLAKSDNAAGLLASFQVNFPETFCFLDHERCWLTQRKKGGFKLHHVEEKEQFSRQVASWGTGEDIVCVKKVPGSRDGRTFTSVLKTYTFSNFFDECSERDAMFQRYIAPRNGASSTALCRVAWNSEHTTMSGYYLVGEGPVTSADNPNNIRAFPLRSVPKEAQRVVQEVARVTQQFSALRMEEVVVDLIRDAEGVWWFIQVKSFTLHRFANVPKEGAMIAKYASTTNLMLCIEDVESSKVDTKPNPVKMNLCPLCQCQFPRRDPAKKMTMKMMLELEHHLLKRNVWLGVHVRRVSMEKLTQRYNVCELCWALYLAERELALVEKKLCDSVCVQPQKTVPNLSGLLEQLPFPGQALPRDHPACQQPRDQLHFFDPSVRQARGPPSEGADQLRVKSGVALQNAGDGKISATVPQWITQMRFMLYLYSIEGIDNVADMLLEVGCPLDAKPRRRRLVSRDIEQMMVYYLFGDKAPKQAFKRQLKIKLTTGKTEIEGSLDLDGICDKALVPCTILLFDSASCKIVGNLKVSLGFVIDEPVRTAYVALKQCDDCYVPSLNYVSCHLLPRQWLFCATRGRPAPKRVVDTPEVTHASRGMTLVTSASNPLFIAGRKEVSREKYRRPMSASTVASTMPSRPTSASASRPRSATRQSHNQSIQSTGDKRARPSSAGRRATWEDPDSGDDNYEDLCEEDELDMIQRQLQLLKDQLYSEQDAMATR